MASTTTEMDIKGADCPFCLNATLDALRSRDGVENAFISAVNGCLVVKSHDIDQRVLVDIAATNLHGTATWADETEMVGVKPIITRTHCTNHQD